MWIFGKRRLGNSSQRYSHKDTFLQSPELHLGQPATREPALPGGREHGPSVPDSLKEGAVTAAVFVTRPMSPPRRNFPPPQTLAAGWRPVCGVKERGRGGGARTRPTPRAGADGRRQQIGRTPREEERSVWVWVSDASKWGSRNAW